MPVLSFPPPESADEYGIVAAYGDLHPQTLRLAYRSGIFPWPHEGLPLLWFCPPERAILDFAKLHVPRSLAKARRKNLFRFTVDANFLAVISACQEVRRPEQEGTWITPAMKAAYLRLHQTGDAHSVEAWDTDGNLVGGLYGVDGGGVFSGESMFHTVPNASKLALLHLAEHLQGRGLSFIDIQQMTPHMAALGACEIPRADFLRRWHDVQAQKLTLFP